MRRSANILIALGLLLIAAALCLAAWNVHEALRARNDSAAALAQMGAAEADSRPDFSADTPMPTQMIDGRLYVGRLGIPSLGLDLPVLSDWSYDGLAVAPCRYAGSAYAGNMVICGHNYWTHFAGLSGVDYGAEVFFTDVRGNVFRYQVASVETIAPAAVEDMVESNYDLSLFTCNFSGMARVTVRCVEMP